MKAMSRATAIATFAIALCNFQLGEIEVAVAAQAEEYGMFSLSLGVSDLNKSFQFYRLLGFTPIDGGPEKGYFMLAKGDVKIGLFTFFKTGPGSVAFNPKDVRAIVRDLKSKGLKFKEEPKGENGAAYALLLDPDGNHILFDQF